MSSKENLSSKENSGGGPQDLKDLLSPQRVLSTSSVSSDGASRSSSPDTTIADRGFFLLEKMEQRQRRVCESNLSLVLLQPHNTNSRARSPVTQSLEVHGVSVSPLQGLSEKELEDQLSALTRATQALMLRMLSKVGSPSRHFATYIHDGAPSEDRVFTELMKHAQGQGVDCADNVGRPSIADIAVKLKNQLLAAGIENVLCFSEIQPEFFNPIFRYLMRAISTTPSIKEDIKKEAHDYRKAKKYQVLLKKELPLAILFLRLALI